MQNTSKVLLLLSGLTMILVSAVIAIPTLSFAKDVGTSHTANLTLPKLANNSASTSQTYSFVEHPFDAIKLAGDFELTVQVSHQPHTANVVVTANNNLLPYIKVYVKNKTLHISKKEEWEFHSFKKIKIMVNVENLESIKTNGSGNSYINNIKTNDFVAEINGSGNIVLQGSAEKIALEIHGSGKIGAKNIIAKKAKVSIYGSGHIITNATQKIGINIQGSGTVEYYGAPQEIEQSFSGSGKIRAMK